MASRSASQHTVSSTTSVPDAMGRQSRSSTPPTPPLHNEDHDALADEQSYGMVPIAPPETLAARRVQSDMASARIGQLLLQGWVLLNAQCQGSECWAIPLMRSPKNITAGNLSLKRKWCVICEHDWEASDHGSRRDRTAEALSVPGASTAAVPLISHAPKASSSTLSKPNLPHHPMDVDPSIGLTLPEQSQVNRVVPSHAVSIQSVRTSSSPIHQSPMVDPQASSLSGNHPDPALFAARQAIGSAITRMSTRLQSQASNDYVTAEALIKMTEAIEKMLHLYQSM